jgi:hypothetical protein
MQSTPAATVTFQLAPTARRPIDWASAWPDALAFGVGLAVARWAGWGAGDLIWSLWLASLVVGYTTIVWMIGHPAFMLTFIAWRSRHEALNTTGSLIGLTAVVLLGAAFMLAFFTVHFGGFHFIHSSFLQHFFPLDGPGAAQSAFGDKGVFVEVLRRYWVFLPSAFLSHRAVFMRTPLTLNGKRWAEGLIKNAKSSKGFFLTPYVNVLRMHGLIFFFAFAHFAGLDNFAVYAVIYMVYFFPWRLARRGQAPIN